MAVDDKHTSDVQPEKLIGTWFLVELAMSGTKSPSTDAPTEPARGIVIYGADGFMSMTVSMTDRNGEPARGISWFHHVAKWWVEDGFVSHEVIMAFDPASVGAVQTRRVHLQGGGRELTFEGEGFYARYKRS